MRAILRAVAALFCGTVFGLGLAVSGMVDPARVRGFLDVSGHWNPALVFVLAGAVTVAFLGVRLTAGWRRPAFDDDFHLPRASRIDAALVVGAAIFGAGWGLAGFCPGPAIAALTIDAARASVFVVAMAFGMRLHDLARARLSSR